MTRQFTLKFKPNSSQTKDYIKDNIIPKLNMTLPELKEATEEEIIVAVSSFLAHGRNFYTIGESENPLLKEIKNKLIHYGIIVTWDNIKYKLGVGLSSLTFATVNSDPIQPKVDTSYNTRYSDGTHCEVEREEITLVNGFPAVTWEAVKPEIQIAYLTGKVEQHSRQYISLESEKLPTTLLKAEREELRTQYEQIINTASEADLVWRYRDGLISTNLTLIEKAVNHATIKLFGRADFGFLAHIQQNDRQGQINNIQSIGGTST